MKSVRCYTPLPLRAAAFCAAAALSLAGCRSWQLADDPAAHSNPAVAPSEVSPERLPGRESAEGAAAETPRPRDLAAARRATQDESLQVRLAGIEALGNLGGPEAIADLRQIATREGEIFQAAAIAALARLEDWESVRRGAEDKSWRVRRAAAAALAADQSAAGTSSLRRLLADRSTEVQIEAIRSLSGWPLSLAGPLLLSGLESGHYATRIAAQRALAEKWPRAASVSSVDLERLTPPRPSVLALRAAWVAEYPASDQEPRLEQAETRRQENPKVDRAPADDKIELPLLLERLRNENKHERLTAAVQLAERGFEPGSTALEGLTFDLDPEIRRSAAAAIGSLRDPFLMAPLVRLLDDEPAVRLAAIKGLLQIVGHDVPRDESPAPANAAEEAERWRAWYLRGGFAGRS